MNLKSVLEQARELVEPTEEERERIEGLAAEILGLVEEASQELGLKVRTHLGGSVAKDTWLRGFADIDVFARFPPSLDQARLEKDGLALGRLALSRYGPILRYSEHPYVEARVDGTRVNVVPCYDVERGRWISAADRSPFHTELIRERLPMRLRTDVRLLKRMAKNSGVYGSEIATAGFSGYVCEVLVMTCGGFLPTLETLAGMKRGQVIGAARKEDLARMQPSGLTLPDPVDSARNLGTAISPSQLSRLILASRKFLEEPDFKFFTEERIPKPTARPPRASDLLLLLTFQCEPRSVDILWGQLKRSTASIRRQLAKAGFEPCRASCGTNERDRCCMAFLLLRPELPPFSLRAGPPIFLRDDFTKFATESITKGDVAWFEGERAHILREAPARTGADFLTWLLTDGLKSSGVAPGLIPDLSKGFEVLQGRDAWRRGMRKDDWMRRITIEVLSSERILTGGS